jgi:hypothetical protein
MFKVLSNLPQFPEHCIREAYTAKYSQVYSPDQLRAFSSFNNTKFVKVMQEKFGVRGGLYMKNTPMSYYDWHVDMGRQCSLNWVIKNNAGKAFYRENINPSIGSKSITFNLTQVKYILYKPTLLDVTKHHCVINDTEEERVIFSMSIDAPFNDVSEYLSNLQIVDYESC